MKILAISGSLRAASKNSTALRAAARFAGEHEVIQFRGIGLLPHFSQDLDDLDNQVAPAPVLELRRELRSVDAVMICSPEYAHGVAGAMKNSLDWLVGSGELSAMPTLVMNLSPSSFHAHRALLETLRTMEALVVERTLPVPISGRELTEDQLLALPAVADFLRDSVAAVVKAVEDKRRAEVESTAYST